MGIIINPERLVFYLGGFSLYFGLKERGMEKILLVKSSRDVFQDVYFLFLVIITKAAQNYLYFIMILK